MQTETFDDSAAFRAALAGKQRPPAKDARPGLPRAGRSAPTGLTTLLVAGWSIEFRVGAGYKLERGGLSTGWMSSEKAACDAAKRLS